MLRFVLLIEFSDGVVLSYTVLWKLTVSQPAALGV